MTMQCCGCGKLGEPNFGPVGKPFDIFWCAPCFEEMIAFERACEAQDAAGYNDDEFDDVETVDAITDAEQVAEYRLAMRAAR